MLSKKAKRLSSNAFDLSCEGIFIGVYSKLGDKGEFWSSSTQSDHKDKAWLVDFYYGSVDRYGKAGDNYVRCVRSE